MDQRPQQSAALPIAAGCAAALAWLAGPSVGVRDAGELSAAAFTLGVPHPTGFALDMVVLRCAMLVPVGDVAFRANLATAAWMALAAGLSCALARALLRDEARTRALAIAAALPAVVLLASRSVVRAGTATEVYASSLSVAVGALLLATRATAADGAVVDGRRRRLAAWMLGATACLHTGARPAVLLAVALLALHRFERSRWASRLGAMATCAVLGALPVLYLPLAARRGGPIDWGDPRTPARLWRHLSAARIRAAFAHRILVPWRVPEDLARVASVLYEDLGPAVLVLAVTGAFWSVRDRRARWISVIALVDVGYATLINPMGVADRQTLFVAQAALAVLAVFALLRVSATGAARAAALRSPRKPDETRGESTPVAHRVALVGAAAIALWALVRADYRFAARADGWAASEVLGGAGALGGVPPRALVLCESDDLCGVAFYAQAVEGERPDCVVLPRQHLADPPTWRRARPDLLLGDVPAVPRAPDLRVARLRGLVARFAPRVRWEPGDVDDERLARVRLGTSESPVLASIDSPPQRADEAAAAWLAPRVPSGVGARAIAASVLFGAGRRLAALDLAFAVPLWEAALARDPEHAPSYTNLGVVAARAGELPRAIVLTRRALQLDPERITAWRNLEEYCGALGDARCAEEARRELARRTPR